MKKIFIILTLVLLTTACGKKANNKSAALPEGSAPEISLPNVETPPELTPIADDTSGVIVTDDAELKAMSVRIPARRKYSPTIQEDGLFNSPKSARFKFPSTLTVISGRSANGIAIIASQAVNGVSYKCIYLGNEKNASSAFKYAAKPYQFDFCVEGSVVVTEKNRKSLKASSQNLINCRERSSTDAYLERGDTIKVQVWSGNDKKVKGNTSTEVAADIRLNY